MNELEENLKRQTRRSIPVEWRKQILSVAQTRKQNGPNAKPAWRLAIEEIFWPSPKAWIGLSCIWILLALIHFTRVYANESKMMAAESAPAMMAFGEEEKLLTETFGQITRSEAVLQAPKKAMTPRSGLLSLFRSV